MLNLGDTRIPPLKSGSCPISLQMPQIHMKICFPVCSEECAHHLFCVLSTSCLVCSAKCVHYLFTLSACPDRRSTCLLLNTAAAQLVKRTTKMFRVLATNNKKSKVSNLCNFVILVLVLYIGELFFAHLMSLLSCCFYDSFVRRLTLVGLRLSSAESSDLI